MHKTLAIAFILSLPAHASTCLVIEGKQIFDSNSGTASSTQGGGAWVEVERDKITATSLGSRAPRPHCQHIQKRNLMLLPGLIDTHMHLFIRDQSYEKNFSAEMLRTSRQSSLVRLGIAKRIADELLNGGITTIRDLGNSGQFLDKDLRDKKKSHLGLLISGPGLAWGKAQFETETADKDVKKEYLQIQRDQDLTKILRPYLDAHVDWLKVFADNAPNPESMPKEVLEKIVSHAHAASLRVAIHTTLASTAKNAVFSGADSLEHGFALNSDTVLEMAKRKIFLVPTDYSAKVCKIIAEHNPEHECAQFSQYQSQMKTRLLAAKMRGVPIAFGSDMYLDLTHDQLSAAEATREGLIAYTEEGLTPGEALQSATSGAARLLGMANKIGVLEPGAFADIIGIEGNPLEHINEIHKVRFVMKNGQTLRHK